MTTNKRKEKILKIYPITIRKSSFEQIVRRKYRGVIFYKVRNWKKLKN